MHILLTDRLECPRCGAGFGLVLLADQLRDRRVLEGSLGCANCRETYPVVGGFADLRPTPRGEPERFPGSGHDTEESATRMGAFLGITRGPATVVLFGPPAAAGSRLSALVADLEVVAVLPSAETGVEADGVSRITVGARLPFRAASLDGAVVEGALAPELLGEILRVLRPGSRVVVLRPDGGVAERLEEAGLDLLVSAGSAVVGTVKSHSSG